MAWKLKHFSTDFLFFSLRNRKIQSNEKIRSLINGLIFWREVNFSFLFVLPEINLNWRDGERGCSIVFDSLEVVYCCSDDKLNLRDLQRIQTLYLIASSRVVCQIKKRGWHPYPIEVSRDWESIEIGLLMKMPIFHVIRWLGIKIDYILDKVIWYEVI